MATVPDCKLKLLVRKQKAVEQDVGGKRDQMAQKPVQEQSLVKRKSRKQRQRWRKTGKRLEVAEVPEQSLRPTEALEWSLNPKETEKRSWELMESGQWEKSSGEAQEQNKNLVEPQEQTSGDSEMKLSPGEESKESSGEPGTEQGESREKSGLLETQRCLSPEEFQALSSGGLEGTERLNPRENVKMSSGQTEVQNILSSGKALEWYPGGSEAEEQKLELSGPEYKKLQLPKAAEKEAGDGGRMVSSLKSHSSVISFFLLKKVRSGGSGPQHPLPPSVSLLSPDPPSSQSPKSLLMNLFCRRKTASYHNSLWSKPQATYLLPEPQLPDSEKEYPTSEEIMVIGGYISLNQSCLAKSSSERRHKQLKISFKEPVLESIYYYPSESAVPGNLDSTLRLVSPPRIQRRRNCCYFHCQRNMGKY